MAHHGGLHVWTPGPVALLGQPWGEPGHGVHSLGVLNSGSLPAIVTLFSFVGAFMTQTNK